MGAYLFKQFRRKKPGGTTGELIRREPIEAEGLASAEQIAARDFLPSVDFKTDFAMLEGEAGSMTCWFTGYQNA